MTYVSKTKGFKHQIEIVDTLKTAQGYALFWEQGCGKTKPILDSAGQLYLEGKITGLLVVAPNGVHRNWVTDEIPRHLGLENTDFNALFYLSGKTGNRKFKALINENLNFKGLSILTISYDALTSGGGKLLANEFLKTRKSMMVLDESHKIKNPASLRTKTILLLGKLAKYKRILSGTPVTKGPFDIFTQIKFLDEKFWWNNDLGSYAAYKNNFGIWKRRSDVLAQRGYDPGYDELVGYKNVEKLEGMLKSISSRVTKITASLNLPEKLYSKVYYELSPTQRKLYDDLAEEYVVELQGETIEASLAIVRLLRLQQLTSGYLVNLENELIEIDQDKNTRLECLKNILETIDTQTIIWARFTKDIDLIMNFLGTEAVRYDGKVSTEQRSRNKEAFISGEAKYFVANQSAASTGLTLTQAKNVIYYSNSFNYTDRAQSEDRAHRIGQKNNVNYYDIVAVDTLDNKIIGSLVDKLDIASTITGDNFNEWIR